MVARLRERRWSTTRIAEAIGVDDETVRRDLSGSAFAEAESPVTDQDGKSYPSTMPAPSQIADRRDRAQELRTGSADGALAVLQSPTSSPGRPLVREPSPIQFGWQARIARNLRTSQEVANNEFPQVPSGFADFFSML